MPHSTGFKHADYQQPGGPIMTPNAALRPSWVRKNTGSGGVQHHPTLLSIEMQVICPRQSYEAVPQVFLLQEDEDRDDENNRGCRQRRQGRQEDLFGYHKGEMPGG